MPSLPTSVEELNPLIPSDEQLQKELKEDFEASMAEVINNRKVSDSTCILLEGLECMFADMMDILRGCYTTGRGEAKRNVVDEIKVFINKVKEMKDLCDNNHEDHVNNEINQAMSSMHKLDNVGHLVAQSIFLDVAIVQSSIVIGIFWMISTMLITTLLRKDLLTQESLIETTLKSILLQNCLTKIF